MNLRDFDFKLDEQLIAQRPIHPRDEARLLVIHKQANRFENKIVKDLSEILNENYVLVLNNTKVLPTKLEGKRIRDTSNIGAQVSLNLHQKTANGWRAFVKGAKKINVGDFIEFNDNLRLKVLAKNGAEIDLLLTAENEQELFKIGKMPLPHYIKRTNSNADEQDKTDYQTIYAKDKGAVAAPTAGLHFTEELFSKLQLKGIEICYVTLHVGAGTFLPLKNEDISKHRMHKEYGYIDDINAQKLNYAKRKGKKIISVGTTSLRILETIANLNEGEITSWHGETDIFISPGYKFKAIDGLMTNFHLPKSSLFILVSALMGLDTMQEAYCYAIKNKYRFFSYGDASLLLP